MKYARPARYEISRLLGRITRVFQQLLLHDIVCRTLVLNPITRTKDARTLSTYVGIEDTSQKIADLVRQFFYTYE